MNLDNDNLLDETCQKNENNDQFDKTSIYASVNKDKTNFT